MNVEVFKDIINSVLEEDDNILVAIEDFRIDTEDAYQTDMTSCRFNAPANLQPINHLTAAKLYLFLMCLHLDAGQVQ